MTAIDYELVCGHGKSALIVEAKTGIIYTSQTGGMACHHPECEGYLLTLEDWANQYNDCPHGCYGASSITPHNKIVFMNSLNDFFTKNVPNIGYNTFKFKIDESRIDELEEAWWPVIFEMSGYMELSGKGYITKENCD